MSKRGFTLIELSIVLVIIGLVAGGVLVGKDLIQAAKIRQTISQIEEFDTAANTFRNKYNCLPGDCINASQFVLGSAPTGYNTGNGDGDGIVCDPTIVGHAAGDHETSGPTECMNFWYHLKTSNLLKSPITGAPTTNCFIPGLHSPSPPTAIKASATVACGIPGTVDGLGGWGVLDTDNISSIPTGRPGYVFNPIPFLGRTYMVLRNTNYGGSVPGVIVPNDMRLIDTKIDDGLPEQGKVFVVSSELRTTGGLYPTFSKRNWSSGNVYPDISDIDTSLLVIKAAF